MLKLKIIQAEFGDCFLLEFGTPGESRFMLIDGGPGNIYQPHLRLELQAIQQAGRQLDLVVLSHIDEDHIYGLLELAAELRAQASRSEQKTVEIAAVWHNTFSQLVGEKVDKRLRALEQTGFQVRSAIQERIDEPLYDLQNRSIAQGDELTAAARSLGVPLNPHFTPHELICQENIEHPVDLGGLSIRILGPNQKNLERLRKDWIAWLNKRKKALALEDPLIASRAAASLDSSVPNLSSIMFLAQADGKQILFTGDGRADHLLKSLKQMGLLGTDGSMHVDILKVPHHGSKRNNSMKFFETVTADKYIFSANGKEGNPDYETLEWLVKAANKQGRQIDIIATNVTDSIRALQEEYPQSAWGYRLEIMPKGISSMVVDLETGRVEIPQPVSPHIEVTATYDGGKPMSKKALLVGINNFIKPSWALRGCVNDTQEMQSLLTTYFGFADENIKLLCDQDATHSGIREGLEWLLSDYNGSDVRVFHFSSHGSQVDDDSQDELEALDEVIIPYDHSWSNPFRDDHLREIFDQVPVGVNFTFIADCCHSGSIQRGLFDQEVDFKPRFLPPPAEITDRIVRRQLKRDAEADAYAASKLHEMLAGVPQSQWATVIPEFLATLRKRFQENRYGIVDYEKNILLAGCEDRQTSADAFIEGMYRGAFTWALGKSIREANGNLTYEDLIRTTYGHLKNYEQKPQLEGPVELRRLKAFSPFV